jgi:hypothetical protein
MSWDAAGLALFLRVASSACLTCQSACWFARCWLDCFIAGHMGAWHFKNVLPPMLTCHTKLSRTTRAHPERQLTDQTSHLLKEQRRCFAILVVPEVLEESVMDGRPSLLLELLVVAEPERPLRPQGPAHHDAGIGDDLKRSHLRQRWNVPFR